MQEQSLVTTSSAGAMTMQDANMVIVTQDTYSAGGVLLVAAGAIGEIRSRNQGYVGIDFESDRVEHAHEAYVKPAYGGRLFQEIPFINTRSLYIDNYLKSRS